MIPDGENSEKQGRVSMMKPILLAAAMFALGGSRQAAEAAGNAMEKVLIKHGITAQLYISPVNQAGPKVLD